ncbi:MAG: MucB/RseB C-terminal domain-containing protein [Lysobacteraceae bacterium]
MTTALMPLGWRRTSRRFVTLALLALAAPLSAQTPTEWLQRMDAAARQQNFVGTLVYGARGQMDTLRVFHRATDDGDSERLLSLNGEPREMVRHGSTVLFTGNGSLPRAYVRGAATTPFAANELQEALPHYRVIAAGEDRVAGLNTQVIDVRAGDAFRYSWRLWLEAESGLLLKSVRHGVDGIPVELMMFTDIELGAVPSDEQLKATVSTEPRQVDARPIETASSAEARWDIADLPPGFKQTLSERDAAQPNEEHLVFSDGLASVSVYISPVTAGDATPPVNIREGAVSVFSRQVDRFRVYVIGDVPELTVQRFAQGVSPREG